MATQICWMIHKDLVSEWRSRRAWPAMIVLGIVVAVVFSLQIDLPFEYKRQVAASLLWIAIFLAATLSLDRSFALEHEDGCWRALLLYPVSPSSVYLAKLAVNILWLAVLQARSFRCSPCSPTCPCSATLGPCLSGPVGEHRHCLGWHVAQRPGRARAKGHQPDGPASLADGDSRGHRRVRSYADAGGRSDGRPLVGLERPAGLLCRYLYRGRRGVDRLRGGGISHGNGL